MSYRNDKQALKDRKEQLETQVAALRAKIRAAADATSLVDNTVKELEEVYAELNQYTGTGGKRRSLPLLQKMYAQHGLHRKRRPAAFGCACLGRMRLEPHQIGPRHHQFHLVQKHALARSLRHKNKSGDGQAGLFHLDATLVRYGRLAGFCRDSLALWRGQVRF